MLNVNDLLTKIEAKEDKKIVYHCNYLDEDIEVKPIPLASYIAITDKNVKTGVQSLEVICETIYKCVPIFQAQELREVYQEKFKVAERFKIVTFVFNNNMGAMLNLFNFIKTTYGIDEDTMTDEEIKK